MAGGLTRACQLQQLEGAALAACRSDPAAPASPAGFCYIDTSSIPSVGNPDLVKACPAGEERTIRFLGSVVFLVCQ